MQKQLFIHTTPTTREKAALLNLTSDRNSKFLLFYSIPYPASKLFEEFRR